MIKKILILCALVFIISFDAFAHDVWIEKRGNEFVVLYGHKDKQDPYDPSKIKEVLAYDSQGNPLPVKVIKQKDGASLSIKKQPFVITLFFDNGYWVKTTDGFKNISKREAEAKGMQLVEPARYSLKYNKSLIQWAEICTKPLGMKFEIVPKKNPFSLKKGENLYITVLYEGKPLEGAKIETWDHKELTKTDKNGMASVPVESGINVIVAKHFLPLKDNPNADVLSLSTTLTFEVK